VEVVVWVSECVKVEYVEVVVEISCSNSGRSVEYPMPFSSTLSNLKIISSNIRFLSIGSRQRGHLVLSS
jgi:hypothetical protein